MTKFFATRSAIRVSLFKYRAAIPMPLFPARRSSFYRNNVEEVRQILFSPTYGTGMLSIFRCGGGGGGSVIVSALNGEILCDCVTPPGSSLSLRLDLKQSSLLVPQSSTSAYTIAIESEIITIWVSNVNSSFHRFLCPMGCLDCTWTPLKLMAMDVGFRERK